MLCAPNCLEAAILKGCSQVKVDKRETKIVLIGPSHLDIIVKGDFKWEIAYSEWASIQPVSGGSVRNVAENLARLGINSTLLTITGEDIFGHFLCEQTKKVGVQVVASIDPSVRTPVYLALNGPDGQLLLDMLDGQDCHNRFSGSFGQTYIDYLANASFVVTSTDVNTDLFFYLADASLERGSRLLLQISAPSAASKAKNWLSKVDVLFLNAIEAGLLIGEETNTIEKNLRVAEKLLALGPEIVLITLGPDGACVASKAGHSEHVPALNVNGEIISTIGAGDAACAGLLYGLVNSYDVHTSVILGLAAAAITLNCIETVSPVINDTLIRKVALLS